MVWAFKLAARWQPPLGGIKGLLAGRNALALAGASVTQNPRRCGTSQSLDSRRHSLYHNGVKWWFQKSISSGFLFIVKNVTQDENIWDQSEENALLCVFCSSKQWYSEVISSQILCALWFDFQVCWFRSGPNGSVATQLRFKVNSRGQHPGSGVRSHKGPVSAQVPAENLSVVGIVLTSKSRKRNYWLTAMWQWHFLFPKRSQVLKAEQDKAKTSNPIKTISLCVD